MILNGLFEILTTTPGVASILAPSPNSPAGTGVYFSLAAKGTLRPYLVITVVSSAPADKTFEGSTALVAARFQFDSYADDQLTARALIKAVRELLEDFAGPLPEGTMLTMINVNDDLDGPYEQGGKGYLYRCILDMSGFYQEAN
jgi:hypothetical protein